MPGIGVISNANARLNRLHPNIAKRLASVLGDSGRLVSTCTHRDVSLALSEFKKSGIDLLVISGGDGTAHRTIEILLKVYQDSSLPPILLLPCGTQNMIPNSFGLRMRPVVALWMVQTCYRLNFPLHCIKRNMLKVNQHHSFMFGLGTAPRFLKEYYGLNDASKSGAMRMAGKYILGSFFANQAAKDLTRPIPLRIQTSSRKWIEKDCHSFFCSFVEELSLRFKPFPEAGRYPGKFEVLIISGRPYLTALASPLLWWGSRMETKGIQRRLTHRMEIVLDSPEVYTLDGEIYPAKSRFSIAAGRELQFVVPGFRPLSFLSKTRKSTVGPWPKR
jgi:diacylglycerol kinase family enzyme